MPNRSLVLFDDETAQGWEPFALTRPVGELMFGALTLRARAERTLGAPCIAHLGAEHLQGFTEDGTPPVRRLHDPPIENQRFFLCSRAVPAWKSSFAWPDHSGPVEMDGQVVGWVAAEGENPPPELLADPASFSADTRPVTLAGRVLNRVWDLIGANPEQLAADIDVLAPFPGDSLPAGAHQIGRHALLRGSNTRVEPGVLLDTTEGPIWLDDGVVVRAFTRLAGPVYVGPGSAVLGGAVEAASIGPVCKIRGEFAESIALGYVNKAHDGHIGHAYLGRWVNLGAETTNSDLKNNYGTVRLWTPEGEADTGLLKLGCLLGDHVKTGIGLLLNTGTVVGAGSNLFGAEMPPRYVAPFSWGTGDDLVPYRVDKFLEVAERAMARRAVALAAPMREQLRAAWRRARGDDEAGSETRGVGAG